MRMPRPPVLFADFCPYPCTRRTQPYGQPTTAVRQPSYPAARSAHGALGGCPGFVWIAWVACACPFGAATAVGWVHQPKPVRVCNDPGAEKLGLRWPCVRASLCVCWPRYALCDADSGRAVRATGMRKSEKRGLCQSFSVGHRVQLVSAEEGFRLCWRARKPGTAARLPS